MWKHNEPIPGTREAIEGLMQEGIIEQAREKIRNACQIR